MFLFGVVDTTGALDTALIEIDNIVFISLRLLPVIDPVRLFGVMVYFYMYL